MHAVRELCSWVSFNSQHQHGLTPMLGSAGKPRMGPACPHAQTSGCSTLACEPRKPGKHPPVDVAVEHHLAKHAQLRCLIGRVQGDVGCVPVGPHAVPARQRDGRDV